MIELEDNVGDIIGKAQRGLGISDSDLGKKSGMSADAVRKARDGQADEAILRAIAAVLDLDPNALVDLAQGKWKPDKLENFDGLAQFSTSYGGMLVNAYLVWDPATKHAAAFDTGADCAGMLKLATKENLSIQLILLTHAHSDHVPIPEVAYGPRSDLCSYNACFYLNRPYLVVERINGGWAVEPGEAL